MSTTIDKRIVEMRFDNKQFESNVSTTMSTLDKLKKSLNLSGAAKGLDEVSNAARKCDVASVGVAAEKVGLKFNAMYTMADQALRNITNSAMAAGKRIVSALTIDPIKTGFQEYETQINAIQTILANTESKGTTLDDVNGALDELNTYADKTIYNFTEMTRNIGTFTAAGVDLDTSVSAIKGIANLAAVSGSTSQQASTAMYQLSQAMASGTVKLMDWNSVVNAGMGGQVFQDALKETAKVHGIAIEDIIKKNGSFRESLSEGWLTTEILTDTLAKFTGDLSEEQLKSQGYTEQQIKDIMKLGQTANDAATKVKTFTQLFDTLKEAAQSGWTQTWEILVGDFEEAKALLTTISDVVGGFINQMSESRNELLENWKVMGGRQDLIDSFKNIFEGIVSVVKPIRDAFREIFPPATAEQLFKITESFKEFTAKLKLSSDGADNLKRTFKGILSVFKLVIDIVKAAFKAIGNLFGGIGDLGGGILGVTANIGDWLTVITEAIRQGNVFGTVFGGIAKVFNFVIKVISGVVKGFASLLDGMSIAEKTADGIQSVFGGLGELLENFTFIKVLKGAWNIVKNIASGFAKVLKSMFSGLGEFNFDRLLDIINSLLSGGVLLAITKFVKGLTNSLDSVTGIFDGVTGIFDGLKDSLVAYQTQLKADALIKIAGAIALLVASLVVLSLIDSDKLTDAVMALAMLFTELMGAMAVFTKITSGTGSLIDTLKSLATLKAAGTAMIQMGAAILILAVALRVIADLDIEELGKGLLGIAGLAAILVAMAKLLSTDSKKVIKGALQMVIFSAAIAILASVCKSLSQLSWEDLAKGLVGVGVLLASVALFMNTAKFSGKSILTATGIVILAAAIKILASACKDFAYMEWDSIGKGLAAVGALLVEVALFTNLTGNAKKVIASGVALLAIAAAMKIFASAINDMASMSWGELGKGLLGIAGALAAVTIALNLMPKNMIFKAAGLVIVASALLILHSALSKMGSMTWESIGKGLVTLGGSMLILAVGLHAMNGTLAGSAALLIAVSALLLLTPVLKTLGGMSWGSIAKGLIAIAGAFTVIGVAAAILGPHILTIMGLSVALALIGVGMLATGAGLAALGAGLSALAVGLSTVVASLGVIVVGIVEIIAAFIKGVIKGLGEGIILLCEMIAGSASAIGEALIAVIRECCKVLIECAPEIANTVLELLVQILDSLVKYTPKIVNSLFDFVIGLLDGLADRIPDLIKSVVNIFVSIFQGAIDALGDIDPSALIQGLAAVGLMAGLVAALAAIVPLIPSAMVGVVGLGVVMAELAVVIGAIGALAQLPGLSWLIHEGGNLLEAIGTAIGQFIGGVVGGIAKGFTGSLPEIANDLSLFMDNLQPFIEGAKSIDASVVDGVKNIAGVILAITGASIIQGMTSWLTGGNSVATFATELPLLGMGIKAFSDSVSGVSAENISSAAGAAKALAEMTNCIPNSGGIVSWFAGDNSISKFASELPVLGMGLNGFSKAVSGINPEAMIGAANSAKILAEMTNSIPNSGGVASWFAGDNSVSKFASDLVLLGTGLKGFSTKIEGINPENVTAAANAAKSLAEMTTYIPNSGGVASWFAGDNSVSKFSSDMVSLGTGLKGFSEAVVGVNPESVTAAANAAKSLAQMTSYIPNSGGVVSWFTGDASISKFSNELPKLGKGLKGFADSTNGINPETMVAAANSAKALAEMTTHIPKENGVASWFTGESSVANFADKLPKLGKGLKGFSESTNGINPETMTSAANAAKSLAEMTAHIPKEGGIKAWFTGETSISNFSGKLPTLGKGLKGFSDSVEGINPENVTAAANAAKSLAQMTETVPKETSKIITFGENLVKFGSKLKSYFEKTAGISDESTSGSKKAIEAVEEASSVDSSKLNAVSKAVEDITKSLQGLAKVPADCAGSFKKAMKELGDNCTTEFVKQFDDLDKDLKKKAKAALDAFVEGVDGKKSAAEKACKSVATACANAIKDKKNAFSSAGKALVEGFANGISANSYLAEAKAKAMAKAAEKAAKEALDINSPSKVFMDIGGGVPEGFAIGVDKLGSLVKKSVEGMSNNSIDGVKKGISRIADLINSDIDAQPTIRPVLDLSDVKNGANSINGLFNSTPSLGLLTNVGAINSLMAQKNQNGANDDVVAEITKLRKDLADGDRAIYNIDGITISGNDEIEAAFETILRAAKIERRM